MPRTKRGWVMFLLAGVMIVAGLVLRVMGGDSGSG